MIFSFSRVAAAGLTAVSVGGFAAPAVAATSSATSSSAVATAIKQQDQKDKAQLVALKHLDAKTIAQAKALLPKITAAETALQNAAGEVAKAHPTSTAQRAGQNDWVRGTRKQATGVAALATAIRSLIKGNKSGAKTQFTAALKTVAAGDKLTIKADGLLGLPKTD